MHKYCIGLLRFKNIAHPGQHPTGDVRQVLSGLHEVQVYVRGDLKQLQHLIQHLSVLRGDADDGLQRRCGLQRMNERRHFDGLRTSPKDD